VDLSKERPAASLAG